MPEHQHQGAHAPGPLVQSPDPRVGEFDVALRAVESVVRGIAPGLTLSRDVNRANQSHTQRFAESGQELIGTVVHPIAGLGWYKVQCGGGAGFVAACDTMGSNHTPLGPRPLGCIPPNSLVRLYKPRNLGYAYIVGVIPVQVRDGRVVNPDWVVQGGGSGYKREAVHYYPIKSLYAEGGVKDFSGQRPMDSTSLERGFVSSTGVAVTIDDYLAQVRVSEECGLFLSYFDSHARLSGRQMDIDSAAHEWRARDDEGETGLFEGVAAYPYEALGLYAPGLPFCEVNGDESVQYSSHRAKMDLPAGGEDLQPIYRRQTHKGFLGQGGTRTVMRPAADSGSRRYSDAGPPDEGLFKESIGLDGSLTVQSAKSLLFVKRCMIVVPREVRRPEDGAGDDAAAGNYRASGQFGAGPEHKVHDFAVAGDDRSMRRVAAVMEYVSHAVNWKALHPFHYHAGDYRTVQEAAASSAFARAQEFLDLAALATQQYVPDPTPKKLRIDARYGSVDYFERQSLLYFLDDGGVVLSAGGGESLVLAGGTARLEAPGDVQLCPGRSVVALGEQVVLRAKRSVDISAAEHDVRIKAERNMQMLAGNSGRGGLLLESRSVGRHQVYDNKIGEEVESNGVVVKATGGLVAVYGKEVYVRTGADGRGDGDIVLDAAKGRRNVIVKTKEFNLFCAKEASFFYGPLEEDSTVTRAYHFGKNACVFDVKMLLGGKLISYTGGGGPGGAVFEGGVYGTKSFATMGVMADKKGLFLGKIPNNFSGVISTFLVTAAQAVADVKQAGELKHEATVVDRYYNAEQPGDDDTVTDVEFSYRDDDAEGQYGVAGFKWPESRWQQMVRSGGASGGVAWAETPVAYQGRELYPWPGRKKWLVEDTFLRLPAGSLYDAAAGVSADRPAGYEDPAIPEFAATTMADGYTLIR